MTCIHRGARGISPHTKLKLTPNPRNHVDGNSFRILLTSGASCPDALVEGVIRKLASFYRREHMIESIIAAYDQA